MLFRSDPEGTYTYNPPSGARYDGAIAVTAADLNGAKIEFSDDPESSVIPLELREMAKDAILKLLNAKDMNGIPVAKEASLNDLFHFHFHSVSATNNGNLWDANGKEIKRISDDLQKMYNELNKLNKKIKELTCPTDEQLDALDEQVCKLRGKIKGELADLETQFYNVWNTIKKYTDVLLLFHSYENPETRPMKDYATEKGVGGLGNDYPGRRPRVNFDNDIIFPDPNKEPDDVKNPNVPSNFHNQINFFFTKQGNTYKLHFRFGAF